MNRSLRVVSSAVILLSVAFAGYGCKDEQDPTANGEQGAGIKPESLAEEGVTEKHGDVSITWLVTPEGEVWGAAKKGDAPVAAAAVKGKLTVRPRGAGDGATHDVAEKGDVVHASVGKLDPTLTEVRYDLTVDGQKAAGVLHLPAGGTKQILASAHVAAKAKVAALLKGPHGGAVQVVGDQVVEIVGQKGSGQVRVYLLDDDLAPVTIRKEKLRLAVVVGGAPQVVELEADEKKAYFHGTLVVGNPSKVTVVIEDSDEVHVALVGYRPGAVVVVGPSAPVVAIYVVDRWDVVVVDRPGVIVVGGKGKGKGKGKWGKGHGRRGGTVHVR